jgi:hypothetical protein
MKSILILGALCLGAVSAHAWAHKRGPKQATLERLDASAR